MQKLKSNAGKLLDANHKVRLQKKRSNRLKKKHFKMAIFYKKSINISPALTCWRIDLCKVIMMPWNVFCET